MMGRVLAFVEPAVRLSVATLVALAVAWPVSAATHAAGERAVPAPTGARAQEGRGEQARRLAREQRGRPDERETQTEKISRTLNIGADGEIDLSNIAGDILITRSGGGAATLDIVKTARAATVDDARALLPLVTVDIVERGPRVEVRTRYPRPDEMRRGGRRNMNVDVTYKLSAPQNTRIVAKSISGNVSVTDISGALTVESISGTIRIANAGRVATTKTISGNIEMIDSKVEGALAAGTISGVVKLQNVTAKNLTLSTVSGEVVLQDVSCERIEAQAISGNVLFSGELVPHGRYEFTSHSGNVKLAIGGRTGFQIEATSFSGSINSDLPLSLEGGQGTRRGGRGLRGRHGDGSAILELTSFSGSITIIKR
jgi:Putative adhesin